MKCQRFREIVADDSVDLLSMVPEMKAARVHRDSCEECRAYLGGQNMLRNALLNLKEEDSQILISERIGQDLMKSYRNQRKPAKSLSYFRYSILSAAAVLLVAIGAAVWFEFAPISPKPAHPEVRTSSNLNSKQNAISHPAAEEKPADVVATGIPQLRTETTEGNNSQVVSEIATEFFPLGPSNQYQGELQRIRVMVPRASLIQFGLPMNEDRATEPITADLLIAEDGTPHAIRFVQYMQ